MAGVESEGYDAFEARLNAVAGGWDSPGGRRLAEELRSILVLGNRRAALRGEDVAGKALTPVLDPADPRRPGDGPPLAPRDAESRRVTEFVVGESITSGRLVHSAGWAGEIARIFRYHRAGIRRRDGRVKRDVIGVTPETLREYREALARYGRSAAGGDDGGLASSPASAAGTPSAAGRRLGVAVGVLGAAAAVGGLFAYLASSAFGAGRGESPADAGPGGP